MSWVYGYVAACVVVGIAAIALCVLYGRGKAIQASRQRTAELPRAQTPDWVWDLMDRGGASDFQHDAVVRPNRSQDHA